MGKLHGWIHMSPDAGLKDVQRFKACSTEATFAIGLIAIQVPKCNFLLHSFACTHNFQTDTTVAVEINVLNPSSTYARS